MSDSSEEEDLSKFKDAVDDSFMKMLNSSKKNIQTECKEKRKSDRYLEEASHYNDVKVPEEMQKRIGAKVSALIEKKIKFVDVETEDIETEQPEEFSGGVKLFNTSDGFLSCEGLKDTYTETHNIESKKLKKKKRKMATEEDAIDEEEKLKEATITGDYVLSKEETKSWKSRRKEKLFKYKSVKGSKVLTSVD